MKKVRRVLVLVLTAAMLLNSVSAAFAYDEADPDSVTQEAVEANSGEVESTGEVNQEETEPDLSPSDPAVEEPDTGSNTAEETKEPAPTENSAAPSTDANEVQNQEEVLLGDGEGETSFTVDVRFEGQSLNSEAELSVRPSNVKVYIWAASGGNDPVQVGSYTVTSNDYYAEGSDASKIIWRKTIEGLPSTDENGNPISYSATQNSLGTVYTTTYGEPVVSGNQVSQVINNSYEENWHYKVDLHWTKVDIENYYERETVDIMPITTYPSAMLSISVQRDYLAGSMEARLPLYLFGATGKMAKNLIGVGDEENKSTTENFTYYIDDMGTEDPYDDEVVFYNFRDVKSGNNFNCELGFEVAATSIFDCEIGESKVKATAQFPGQAEKEPAESREITYRYDTGAKFANSDSTRTTAGFPIYYEGDESAKTNGYANFKDYELDTENYNYMVFDIGSNTRGTTQIYANQDYTLTSDVTLGEAGEIIAASGLTSEQVAGALQEDGTYQFSTTPQYILVKYPREATGTDENGESIFDNHYSVSADLRLTCNHINGDEEGNRANGIDFNDTDVIHVYSDGLYRDYRFTNPTGIFSGNKSTVNGSYFPSAALSHLGAGREVRSGYNLYAESNGYDNAPDGFRLELDDDAVYVQAVGKAGVSEYIRLTEQDFYFDTTSTTLSVTYNDVDRNNGRTINKISEIADNADMAFQIWAKTETEGDWILVGSEPVSSSGSLSLAGYSNGYAAIRVVSPEGLTGHLRMSINNLRVVLRPDSPLLSDFAERSDSGEDDFVSTISISNFSAVRNYLANEDGEYEWGNRGTGSTNSLAAATGLDAADQDEDMGYQYRFSSSQTLNRINPTGGMTKSIGTNDPVVSINNKQVTVNYTLSAYEELPGSYGDWDEALYEGFMLNDGMFVDLLPVGYEYNANVAPTASCNSPSGSGAATVTSVETIDDFQTTGRQLVIFHVETGYTTNEEGEEVRVTNWGNESSSHRSKLTVRFQAIADFQNTKSGEPNTNYAGFQRENGSELNQGQNSNRQIGDNNIVKLDGDRPSWSDVPGWDDGSSNSRYAQASHTANFPSAYEFGIKKTVKADSQMFSQNDVVTVGNDYYYRIRVTTPESNSITKDIVIYDILETAINAGGATGEEGKWQGAFKGINVNPLRRIGINPKVYYSTVEGLTYTQFADGNNVPEDYPEIWSETPPEDLSTVTAICVDARTKIDGTPFQATPGTVLSFDLTMTAPDELQDYEYAYNLPAYNSTGVGTTGIEKTSFNQGNRTTVRLQLPQEIEFTKYYVDEAGEIGEAGAVHALPGATFKLYRCENTDEDHVHNDGDTSVLPGTSASCYKEVKRVVTDESGYAKFSNLTTGSYAVRETRAPIGWTAQRSYWTFEVNAYNGTHTDPEVVVINDQEGNPEENTHNFEPKTETESPDDYELENNRSVRDIPVQKIWQGGTNGRLDAIVVQLYRDGEPYLDPVTLDKGVQWMHTYEDLYRYSLADGHEYEYEIRELTQIPGFTTVITEDTSNVTTNTNYAIQFDSAASLETGYDFVYIVYQDENDAWHYIYTYGVSAANKRVVIPTDDFYIAFRSDYSVIYRGVILSLEPTNEEPTNGGFRTGSGLPGYDTIKRQITGGTAEEWENDTLSILNDANGGGDHRYQNSSQKAWHIAGAIPVNDKAVGIINTRLGNLEVHKEVANNTKNRNDTFDFSAVFTNEDGTPVTQELTYHKYASRTAVAYETLTVTPNANGEVSFDLKHGEWVRFIDLPVDSTYRVWEAQNATSGLYTTTVNFEKSGTIVNSGSYPTDGQIQNDVASGTSNNREIPTVRVTNTYTPGQLRFKIPVEKVITGNDRSSEQTFTFTLQSENNAPLPASAGRTATITGEGKTEFGIITFTAAGNYTYKVKETAGTAKGYTYDPEEHTITVTVTDNGEGILSATWTSDVETDEESVLFTNEYEPDTIDFAIPVSKVITGHERIDSDQKEFTFLLEAENGAPMPDADGETATITDEGNTTFGAITYTAAGTYTYKVKEQNDGKTGYDYDPNVHTVTVTVTDVNGELQTSWKLDDSENNATEDDSVEFTNEYHPVVTTLTIPVTKVIEGNDRPEGGEQKFKFQLTALNNAPKPKKSTLFITDEDTLSFGEITFIASGEYEYILEETDGKVTGYTYDTTPRSIIVYVEDMDGELEVTDVLIDEETDLDPETGVTFTNEYDVTDVTVDMPAVTKVLTGNDRPTEQTFSFVLEAAEGTPMPETNPVTITGEGSVSLGEITYDAAGTYTYTLKETNSQVHGYGYDPKSHTITVVVTDTNSILSAVVSIDGVEVNPEEDETGNITFTNTYAPDAVKLGIPVKKEIEGQVRPVQKTFTFTLEGEDDETPMPEEGGETTTITDEGDSAFGLITYTKAGTYSYTVTEADDGETGYTYDGASYEVTVVVTDTNGELSAKYTVTKDGVNADSVLFTNTYIPEPTEVILPVTKALEGQNRPTEKTFTFVLEGANQDTPMPEDSEITIEGEGSASYEEISYTKAGTYQYTVTEQQDRETGYTYDTASYSVTVTVTDNNGTLKASYAVSKNGQSADKILFTNTYIPEPTDVILPVTKALEGQNRPTEKTFTFVLQGEDENTPMPAHDEISVDGEGSVSYEKINYTKAGTYNYTVSEVDAEETGYDYDDTIYDVTVTVIDENGQLKASYEVTVEGEEAEEILFTNVYEPEPVDLELPVSKVIEGQDRSTEKVFTFLLEGKAEETPMPEETEVTVEGEGSVSYPAIHYTEAGTYHYTVTEQQDDETGYTYDESIYEITVTVTDEDGTLQTEVNYLVGDEEQEEIQFVNSYEAISTSVIIEATKKLENRTLKDKEFTFILKDSDGKELQTATNEADGTIRFAEIEYTEPGVYNYELSEKKESATGITYDEKKYEITVRVTDEDGTLVATIDREKDDLVFTNKYTAPKKSNTGVVTGDTTKMISWMIALFVAMAAMFAVLPKQFKKKEEE